MSFSWILLSALLCQTTHSQVFEPIRIELDGRIDAEVYHLEPLGTLGALLFYESNEIDENLKRRWYFSMLDTTLTEKWVKIVPVSDGMSCLKSTASNDRVVMFFSNADRRQRSQAIQYEILTYYIATDKFNLIGGEIPEKAEIAGFSTLGSSALLTLNLPKEKADLLRFDLTKGTLQSFDDWPEGETKIFPPESLINGPLYITTMEEKPDKKQTKYHFLVFGSNGILHSRWQYTDVLQRSLFSFAYAFDDETQSVIVAGCYGTDKPKRDNRRQRIDIEEESEGLFYLSFSQSGLQRSHFVPFNEFKNIYSALATEDLMYYRQKQARTEVEASKPDIGFNLFNAKLRSFGKDKVFTAEAFRPKYRLETRMEYDIYGRPVPMTYSVFEGYNFYTSIFAAFDDQGGLHWSGNMEIPETVSFSLKPNVFYFTDSTDMTVCLVKNGLIQSTVVDQYGQESGGLEQVKIVSDFSNDKLIDEAFPSILYWYDDFFLVCGVQTIANNMLRDNNPRTVFFINKIQYK